MVFMDPCEVEETRYRDCLHYLVIRKSHFRPVQKLISKVANF